MLLRTLQNFTKLILIIHFMGCQPCMKDMVVLPYQYHFIQQVALHPYHKSYHIGDTIVLEFTTPDKMIFDTISKSFIKADTFQFYFSTRIGSLYDFPKPPPATSYFEISTDKGLNYGRDTTNTVLYGSMTFQDNIECNTDSNYKYSIGVIARARGIYYFYLSYGFVTPCPIPANPAYMSDISYQFNLADCNQDILSTIPSTDLTVELSRDAAGKKAFILEVQP